MSVVAAIAALAPGAAHSEILLLIDHDDSIHRLAPAQIALVKQGAGIGAGLSVALVLLLSVFRARVAATLQVVIDDAKRVFAETAGAVNLREPSSRRILLLILVIGFAVRLSVLDRPMGFDEADTFDYFASRNYFSLLTDYTAPNNHILHTVFVRASYLLFGDSPSALRLPALLAGLAVMPLTFIAGCRLLGQQVAYLATALTAVHPALIHYSVDARGYSAVAAFTLVVFLAAASMRQRRSIFSWLLFVTAGVLGMFTIPAMLYSLAAVSVWVLWSAPPPRRPRLAVEIGLSALSIAAASIVLYAPAAARTGIEAIVANRYVVPVARDDMLAKAAREGPKLVELWTRHVAPPVSVLLLLFWVLGLRRREGRMLALATVLAPLLLMLVHQTIPYARVFLFAAPIACLVVAAGIRVIPLLNVRGLALGLATLLGGGYAIGSICLPSEGERLGVDQMRVAKELLLQAGPNTGVYAALPLSEPIRYTFLTNGRPRRQVIAPDVVDGSLPSPSGWSRLLITRAKREFAATQPGGWISFNDPVFVGFSAPVQIMETEYLEVFRMSRNSTLPR